MPRAPPSVLAVTQPEEVPVELPVEELEGDEEKSEGVLPGMFPRILHASRRGWKRRERNQANVGLPVGPAVEVNG